MYYTELLNLCVRPLPYEPGDELWNDAHISKMMLQAHLSEDTDAASYKREKRQKICDYLFRQMHLKQDASIVDLGCGPGLYCALLAERGVNVTGIDRSESSIRYARNLLSGYNTRFINDSYLNSFGKDQYDAALLISQDFGVLSPDNRKRLLSNIRDSLKTGGYFAFDISSIAALEALKKNALADWTMSDNGFWRPHRHMVLSGTFFYEDLPASCALYGVIDTKLSIYRIYQTYFTRESILLELETSGFQAVRVLSNLWGGRYAPGALTIGLICTKV